MTIPQEIQDLMPERRVENVTSEVETEYEYQVRNNRCIGFNQALQKVEAVIPQIIALAEKRGAEGERERLLEMSERLYGDNKRGAFENVIAVRVSNI